MQFALAVPVLEDKLLQVAVTQILLAIYEVDFLPCSYGYRLGLSAHDAIKALTDELQFGGHHFVVEADIKGFFDNLRWEWLERMLEQRIADGAFLNLIRKWLRAGILEEDGRVIHPQTGTPQGGVVWPVLANIYLHYVLDLWFERVVRPRQRGRCWIIRYADDSGVWTFGAGLGAQDRVDPGASGNDLYTRPDAFERGSGRGARAH